MRREAEFFFLFFEKKGFVVVERLSIEAAQNVAFASNCRFAFVQNPEKPWRTESLISFVTARDQTRGRRGRKLARGRGARKADDDR